MEMMEQTKIPDPEVELFSELRDIRVVFDVGARTDTDYLSIKPGISFHAFEPNHEFFRELESKVALTGRKARIFLNNFGLGDVPGMFKYDNGRQAFEGGESGVSDGEFTFEVKTLDDYARKIRRIDFLKIDTEGYDYKVLLGGRNTLAKCRFIQYEHWDNLQEFHTLLEKDFDMEYVGYRNVLCMSKKLVPKEERKRLSEFIKLKGYKQMG